MDAIIYLVGLVVVILAILYFFCMQRENASGRTLDMRTVPDFLRERFLLARSSVASHTA
jgi:hypothetical protein